MNPWYQARKQSSKSKAFLGGKEGERERGKECERVWTLFKRAIMGRLLF